MYETTEKGGEENPKPKESQINISNWSKEKKDYKRRREGSIYTKIKKRTLSKKTR